MKKHIINTLAAAAILGGLVASCTAPWWAVRFVCLPVMYAGVLVLLHTNTNYITEE